MPAISQYRRRAWFDNQGVPTGRTETPDYYPDSLDGIQFQYLESVNHEDHDEENFKVVRLLTEIDGFQFRHLESIIYMGDDDEEEEKEEDDSGEEEGEERGGKFIVETQSIKKEDNEEISLKELSVALQSSSTPYIEDDEFRVSSEEVTAAPESIPDFPYMKAESHLSSHKLKVAVESSSIPYMEDESPQVAAHIGEESKPIPE